MEIEKDNTIPFLDTTVTRDSDGLLTSIVYRKPAHTDQYLLLRENLLIFPCVCLEHIY